MSDWTSDNAEAALDRLQMSEQQRKQVEIQMNLELIHKRITEALEYAGIDPDLGLVRASEINFNKIPVYKDPDEEQVNEGDTFKTDVADMLTNLKEQETNKHSLMLDVEDFLNITAVDNIISENPINAAFENVLKAEDAAIEAMNEVNGAFLYTEELADRMLVVGNKLMREAGLIYSSSDEDYDSDE